MMRIWRQIFFCRPCNYFLHPLHHTSSTTVMSRCSSSPLTRFAIILLVLVGAFIAVSSFTSIFHSPAYSSEEAALLSRLPRITVPIDGSADPSMPPPEILLSFTPSHATPDHSVPAEALYLALCIISDRRPHSRQWRDLARRTYLFPLFFPSIRLRVRHWFVVGTSDAKPEELTALQEESFRFGDMLLLPLTDQYQGSSGAGGMLQKYFAFIQHVMVDLNLKPTFTLRIVHDAFVHLPSLLDECQKTSTKRLYWGYVFRKNPIQRAAQNKNSDQAYNVCEHYYHPYMSGIGWLISSDVAAWIVGSFPQNAAFDVARANQQPNTAIKAVDTELATEHRMEPLMPVLSLKHRQSQIDRMLKLKPRAARPQRAMRDMDRSIDDSQYKTIDPKHLTHGANGVIANVPGNVDAKVLHELAARHPGRKLHGISSEQPTTAAPTTSSPASTNAPMPGPPDVAPASTATTTTKQQHPLLTLRHRTLQPRFFVNDDVNFGLLMAGLDLEWKDTPRRFLWLVNPPSYPLEHTKYHAEEQRVHHTETRMKFLTDLVHNTPNTVPTSSNGQSEALKTYIGHFNLAINGELGNRLQQDMHALPRCFDLKGQERNHEMFFCSIKENFVLHVHYEQQARALYERLLNPCRCRPY